ncbi:response regulator transcription factor [Clostridium hydrogenum]|uniref:response regulator transcription factor n=1 Tax=Clostridium hydrogenum TaxID=2855764 RepID=UPI001F179009|nr:response regulator [Clostridium hydrogenum]
MKAIIVDDDLLTVEVIRDSINWKVLGIDEVDTAYNITGAKKLFEKNVPDIVVCDIEMPKGSGIDLLKWIRKNQYKSEFIFLTCHESFEFASTALEYNAIGYITKPFNIDKTEMAIDKAVEKIKKERHLNEYSEYGEYWLNNKKIMLQNFWRELLFFGISNDFNSIKEEIEIRNLKLDISEQYYLVLISVIKSENKGILINNQTFEYALKKLSAETIICELDFDNIIYYVNDRTHNVLIILPSSKFNKEIKAGCLNFIDSCDMYLKCRAACYISDGVEMSSLADRRVNLEEMDQNNIVFRNKVFLYGDKDVFNTKGQYSIDISVVSELLENREKIKIVNYMKEELELLRARKNLDASAMYSMHQDFMQVIYAFLYKNEIQAHNLFSDKVSQKLSINANNSIFDMLKWIHFITTKTIDYLDEVKKSYTIIDKAKNYIHENYREDITRKDVAASVFLTPDYLAKMFKTKTGVAVKDYINSYRIEKAKDLLRNSDISISMAASEVGFDNFSYFSTVFKKITGVSPVSFRKEN